MAGTPGADARALACRQGALLVAVMICSGGCAPPIIVIGADATLDWRVGGEEIESEVYGGLDVSISPPMPTLGVHYLADGGGEDLFLAYVGADLGLLCSGAANFGAYYNQWFAFKPIVGRWSWSLSDRDGGLCTGVFVGYGWCPGGGNNLAIEWGYVVLHSALQGSDARIHAARFVWIGQM